MHSKKRETIVRFRKQLQIRCDMFSALKDIINAFQQDKLRKLIMLSEKELGYRYRIYPASLMPRKNEFIVDICNYIAIAHLRDIIKSSVEAQSEENEYEKLKMMIGFRLPVKVKVTYVFGDQSTYRDPGEPDTSFLKFEKDMTRLQARLRQKPMLKIELCHLLFEAGCVNLRNQRPDDARRYGNQMVEEAPEVSYFWLFLGYMLLIRTDVLQRYYDWAAERLETVISMVDIFKNEDLKMAMISAQQVSGKCVFFCRCQKFTETCLKSFNQKCLWTKFNIPLPLTCHVIYNSFILSFFSDPQTANTKNNK